MKLRGNTARLRARLREKQLKYLVGLCQDLSRAAASVGEILDYHSGALSGRVCDALRDALAGLVMAESHIRDQATLPGLVMAELRLRLQAGQRKGDRA
jgi:RecB family exonuclease